MKCVIVGAGKVGFSMAKVLADEEYDVVVIDIDDERLKVVEDHLDAQIVKGNGANIKILQNAGIANTDLLIAVTESDEFNMLACFVAKSLGAKSTIARVREPDYSDIADSELYHDMGIDLIINPERVAAEEMFNLINFPDAHSVKYYTEGRMQMLELKISPKANVVGKKLAEIKFPQPCLVVAIQRGDDQIVIPNGSDQIFANDMVYVLAQTIHMHDVEVFLGHRPGKLSNIVILGGGLAGYYLAKKLENKRGYNIKIIEEEADKCEELNSALEHCLIIHGDGSDLGVLEEENVGAMDAMLALTDDDQKNLLACILAKHLGAHKTIAQIRRSDYVHLIEKVGIDNAVSPRHLMTETIIRFMRRHDIVSITLFNNDLAQVEEIIVPSGAKHIGKELKNLNFPKGAIIGAIVRNNKAIIPSGNDVLLANDHVIVFSTPQTLKVVEEFLMHKK